MMKKFISLLFVLATPLMVMANPVGQEKARKIAQEFMAGSRSNSRTAASTPRELSFKDIGMKNLYAFADETSGGFVIVADDDCVEPVLAYGETDDFNLNAIPTAMQMMLLSYEQQINNIRKTQGTSHSKTRQATATPDREAITPLVKTMWHQYPPFNYYCPYNEVAGRNTLVGCVALTLAQLMYYYQYPQATSVPIPAYTTGTGYKMSELPPTTFDYSQMHLNYDYVDDNERKTFDFNDPSVTEVAKLILYAGCALEMNYSTSGSAANFDLEAIAKYFGYDKGTRYLMAGNYPHDVWEQMVYEELKAGRPVPYRAGAVGNQNHQFIIDGYDGKGYFHANIGEIGRGDVNIYYKLGVLNDCQNQTSLVEFSGYNVYQAGYFGFQPDKGNDPVPVVSVDYGDYALTKADFTRSASADNFKDIKLKATITRHDNNGKQMECGWGLFQNGLMLKKLASVTTDQEDADLGMALALGGGLADGTYQLFPIFRNHDATEWEAYLEYLYTTNDGTPMRHYTATIAGKSLHIGVSSTEPNLKISKVEYYAAYVGEKLDARVYFTNNGTNYENELFFWIDGEMRTGVGAYVDPGKSGYIDFCTAAPAKGSHNVKICTDWEGEKVIYTGTLTVTEPPTYQLEGKAEMKGFGSDWNVHDQLEVTCEVTNTGETTFDNMVIAYVDAYLDDGKGGIMDDIPNGIPATIWNRVWYLHLKPGESTTLSFTLGKDVFKPIDYKYSFIIFNYNNGESYGNLYGSGFFNYIDETDSFGVKYDLNGDGEVNQVDISYMEKLIMRGFYKEKADLNGDKKVNATDLVLLIKHLNDK